MTCKDCIYEKMCDTKNDWLKPNTPTYIDWEYEKQNLSTAYHCRHFKDKSKYIELPCKVGDNVYIQCDTVNQNIPYKIEDIHIDDENISFFATAYDIYYGEFLDEKMFTIDEFEKTVFLTKEEAEARRKELQDECK